MTVKVTKPALNLREELSSLKKPSGVAGEAMLRAETPQEQFNLIGAGRKNLIINGDFQVWQRGTSLSPASNGYGNYTADRWGQYYENSTITSQTDTIDGRITNTLRSTTINTATNSFLFQKIENGSHIINGQTITISFWGKGAITSTAYLRVRLRYYDNASETGVVEQIVKQDSSVKWPTEWTKFEFTVTAVDTSVNATRDAMLIIDGVNTLNPNDYIEIANVQLELGSVATPFEHRSYSEELALCQRYFCKSYSDDTYPPTNTANGCEVLYSDGTTSYHGGYRFPVSMRVQPSISLWTKNGNANQAQLNFTSGSYVDISVYAPSHKSFNVYQSTAGTVGIYAFHYTADAEL